jgi:hypothetical protein
MAQVVEHLLPNASGPEFKPQYCKKKKKGKTLLSKAMVQKCKSSKDSQTNKG